MPHTPHDKAAVSILEARTMLGGIAQATIYKLIDDGRLKTFCIGRRRLVGVDAIRDYITRAEREEVRNSHRAFGIGEHFCIGSHLARLELKVIFLEILKRVRNPRLNGEINWLRSNFISGIKSMPISFDVAAD